MYYRISLGTSLVRIVHTAYMVIHIHVIDHDIDAPRDCYILGRRHTDREYNVCYMCTPELK